MSGGMKMGTKRVDALKNLAFLSQRIAHQEAAIQMAKQALCVASQTEPLTAVQEFMLLRDPVAL